MQVSEADRRVDRLVREISDVVNRRTGANSPIRQIGVDPATARGVRIAGPDAIVLGTDDAALLGRLHRRFGADRRFDETSRALRGVVEAVTDLAVRAEQAVPHRRPPSERGRWDRPEDREHLELRADHHNIQAAVTGACAQAGYVDVVAELARRDVVRQEFAHEVRQGGRLEQAPGLALAGEEFVQRLSEKIPGSDRGMLLGQLNRRPPEFKAREAADQLLGSRVDGWDYADPLPHRAALGEVTRRIEQDFDALDPSRPAAELGQAGRQIAERAAAEADRVAAGFQPEGSGRPQQQAVPMTMLDGVATAGSEAPEGRAAEDPPAATGHGVQAKPLTREP